MGWLIAGVALYYFNAPSWCIITLFAIFVVCVSMEISEHNQRIGVLENEISGLKSDLESINNTLEDEVSSLRSDLEDIHEDSEDYVI